MSGHSTANRMEEMGYTHKIDTKINLKLYIKVDLIVMTK
jgi:hypothetical protein